MNNKSESDNDDLDNIENDQSCRGRFEAVSDHNHNISVYINT